MKTIKSIINKVTVFFTNLFAKVTGKAKTEVVVKQAQDDVANVKAETVKVEAKPEEATLDQELLAIMTEIHALARVHKYRTIEAINARVAKDKETLLRIKAQMEAGLYAKDSKVVKMRKPQPKGGLRPA